MWWDLFTRSQTQPTAECILVKNWLVSKDDVHHSKVEKTKGATKWIQTGVIIMVAVTNCQQTFLNWAKKIFAERYYFIVIQKQN